MYILRYKNKLLKFQLDCSLSSSQGLYYLQHSKLFFMDETRKAKLYLW